MGNHLFFQILFILCLYSCTESKNDSSENELAPKPPNIILIVADDLGYADVGYQGINDVITPNIDALGKSGVIFENGYVTASVCGPSRAAMLTGKYQQRFGSEDNPSPYKLTEEVMIGLPLSEKNLAEQLKKQDYSTAAFGKWHLGGERGNEQLMPTNRGFDEFYGFLEGAALYIDTLNTEKKFMRNTSIISKEERYLTNAIGDEACRFIGENLTSPFFLYLPFSAVHAPLQATEEDLKIFEAVKDDKRRKMLAMLKSMDSNIGRVIKKLDEHHLRENTFIIFISDNGGHPTDNWSYNTPLKGRKGQYYEGGIRIPFLMNWPGGIPSGKVYEHPVSAIDILPTVLSAVIEDYEPEEGLDGKDLRPFLNKSSKDTTPHQYLYWKLVNKKAVRDNEWKLVQHGDLKELYHLKVDPNETTNLINQHSDVVQRLTKAYENWDSGNIPAQYGYDRKQFPVLQKRTRRMHLER